MTDNELKAVQLALDEAKRLNDEIVSLKQSQQELNSLLANSQPHNNAIRVVIESGSYRVVLSRPLAISSQTLSNIASHMAYAIQLSIETAVRKLADFDLQAMTKIMLDKVALEECARVAEDDE